MKPTSYVINTARGGIVNSKDLNDALNNGVIAGAGLDVLDGEPNIPADHPLVLNKKAIVLPHLGSATVETRSIMYVSCSFLSPLVQ
jgi:glyoxylate/hydroxypyruvate reductase